MAPGRAKPKVTRPRVYARVRPMFGRDAAKPELFDIQDSSLTYVKEEGEQRMCRTRRPALARGRPSPARWSSDRAHYMYSAGAEACRYVFDKVFGMESQQEDVYQTIGRTAIEQMRMGYNSTVMAYGQVRGLAPGEARGAAQSWIWCFCATVLSEGR